MARFQNIVIAKKIKLEAFTQKYKMKKIHTTGFLETDFHLVSQGL